MSFVFKNSLPTPAEIREQYPVSKELLEIKKQRDNEIADILMGRNDKFMVIIGPCSADSEDSVLDYVSRLCRVYEKVKDKLMIIPRIYTNKPRTTGDGYKGIASQPDPEKAPDLVAGLIAMRHMHIRAMQETHLTAADEMLYPDNWGYVQDILSYVTTGARSVENQQHRLTMSGVGVAAGMKNPTSGDLSVMLNSIYAAQKPHHFIFRGYEVETDGNPYAHSILRGAVNRYGRSLSNYHYEDINMLLEMYRERDIVNPAVVIDTNHNNSDKKCREQIRIVKDVLHNRSHSEDMRNFVKGVMVESYIVEGCQKIGDGVYGKSITYPCLGWADTEKLIYDIADRV